MFLLNKNIVHWINDIFWHMGFKHETLRIMLIVFIKHLRIIIVIILIILIIYYRFVPTLVLRIMFGRISEISLPYPSWWITWVISFVLYCASDGWHTSVKPILTVAGGAVAAGPAVGVGFFFAPLLSQFWCSLLGTRIPCNGGGQWPNCCNKPPNCIFVFWFN